jgi:hypothetical protein
MHTEASPQQHYAAAKQQKKSAAKDLQKPELMQVGVHDPADLQMVPRMVPSTYTNDS